MSKPQSDATSHDAAYGREIEERENHPPDAQGPDPRRFPVKSTDTNTGAGVEQSLAVPDRENSPGKPR